MTRTDYIALVNEAQLHSYRYYVLAAPTLSDADFDALYDRIASIEAQHPDWLTPDSPTQRVGSDLSTSARRLVLHRTPMLSCQKASTDAKGTNTEKLTAWLQKTEKAIGHNRFAYTLEWKYDGLSCSLIYQDGILISAASRGDGAKGQDITAHAQHIAGIPQQLAASGRVEVRGEIVCPRLALAKMTARYTDCRTAAASLCNQGTPSPDCALLRFLPWNVDAPAFALNGSNYESLSHAAHTLGFTLDTLPSSFDANYTHGLLEEVATMETARASLDIPTDGLVIKVDDKTLFASLGTTAHHPHGSIAYKFAPPTATTVCTRIEVTTGATGRRTPVVHFQPVTLMGRSVHRASVGSEATLASLSITLGSTILVGLANDVRPTVYRVIDPSEITAPTETTTAPSSSVSGDTIAEFSPASSVECPAVSPQGEEEKEEVAPSLYPEEEPFKLTRAMLDDLDTALATCEARAAAERDALAAKELAEIEARLASSTPMPSPSEGPTTSEAAAPASSQQEEKPFTSLSIAATLLSVAAVCLLFPLALALTAFGIPLFSGSLKA